MINQPTTNRETDNNIQKVIKWREGDWEWKSFFCGICEKNFVPHFTVPLLIRFQEPLPLYFESDKIKWKVLFEINTYLGSIFYKMIMIR